MKKQQILLASLLAIVFVVPVYGMDLGKPSEQKIFSVRDLGIDPLDRENLGKVGDFYRAKAGELSKKFDEVASFPSHDFDQNIQDSLDFIAEIRTYQKGFQVDTNKDDLSCRQFATLLCDVQKFIADQQREQEGLVKKDARIKAYWSKVHALKNRLAAVRIVTLQDVKEQKISLLQEIIQESRAIGSKSQAELQGEVGFVRECAPIIRNAQLMITRLQAAQQTPRTSNSAKRSLDDALVVKRSKTN